MNASKTIPTALLAMALAFFALPTFSVEAAKARSNTNADLHAIHDTQLPEDSDDLVEHLDECTTIDPAITQKCQDLLQNGLKQLNGTDGQIAVIDAKTRQLKAWVALNKDGNHFAESPLLKEAFSPRTVLWAYLPSMAPGFGVALDDSVDVDNGLFKWKKGSFIRDHKWRMGGYGKITYREALTKKSDVALYHLMLAGWGKTKANRIWQRSMESPKASNAMEIAALLNCIYHLKKVEIPSLHGDSLTFIDTTNVTPQGHQFMYEVLTGMHRGDGLYARFAPKDIHFAGVYDIHHSKELTKDKKEQTEMSFAGVIPAEEPRYSVCVIIHRPSGTAKSSKDLAQNVINDLLLWLNKR